MPAIKKASANENGYYGNAIVSDKVKDHGNDPFVVKKVEAAKAFLDKNGLNGLPDKLKK
jgi:hypothetical protein